MLPVFTSPEMRSCDDAATERYHIPGIVLMENAARGAADVVASVCGPLADRDAVILCGKGNNGGDGFALARHLLNRGMRVHVFNIGPDEASKGDAHSNLDVLRAIEAETERLRVTLLTSIDELENVLARRPAVVVDALLGTGITSPLAGELHDIVECVNAASATVVALDVPTGVDADSGAIMGTAIRARCTATMGALKHGLLFGRGRECAGELRVVDIGMPTAGFMAEAASTHLVEERDVVGWLPRRAFDAHKYQLGTVFVLAGSVGLTGAAVMASEAALRSGAGIVKLGIPESLNQILEVKLTEVMTFPLKETAAHSLSLNSFEDILAMVNSSSVSIIGPGLSRQYETQNLVRRVIQQAANPLVIDADALFALAGHLDMLQTSDVPMILTPHVGEFARLIDQDSAQIEARRVDLARTFAVEFGVTLVLKGAPTVIGCADGSVFINSTGNPGMATAGSGDILSGIIAGLLAQGASAENAACSAVYLHGLAGDRAIPLVGEYGLIATDLLRTLPETMRSLITTARA